MATTLYNPGEVVWDQKTGEPFIDESGNFVRAAPGLKVSTDDGRSLDGDDVANAAYFRANLFQGEVTREASLGVPYERLVLGQGDAQTAIVAVVAEVKTRTPGILGVVNSQVLGYSAKDRILRWTAVLLRADGGLQQATIDTNGG